MQKSTVAYDLKRLRGTKREQNEIEDALLAYAKSTTASERTSTNEILYWLFKSKGERQGLDFFSLGINDRTSGFSEIRYLKDQEIVVIDYVCIDPELASNSGYFVFLELVCHFVENELKPKYILTEIAYDLDGSGKDEDNRYWTRVLELQGFKSIHSHYMQPSLDPAHPERTRKGLLMVRSNESTNQISRSVYAEIVEEIYLGHYLRWFEPFRSDLQAYEASLMAGLEKIRETKKGGELIAMNGSAKHSQIVRNSTINEIAKKEGFAFLTFGIASVIALASAIASIAIVSEITVGSAVGVFAFSIFVFSAIATIMLPDRINVLNAIGEFIKSFSGTR